MGQRLGMSGWTEKLHKWPANNHLLFRKCSPPTTAQWSFLTILKPGPSSVSTLWCELQGIWTIKPVSELTCLFFSWQVSDRSAQGKAPFSNKKMRFLYIQRQARPLVSLLFSHFSSPLDCSCLYISFYVFGSFASVCFFIFFLHKLSSKYFLSCLLFSHFAVSLSCLIFCSIPTPPASARRPQLSFHIVQLDLKGRTELNSFRVEKEVRNVLWGIFIQAGG